MNQLGGFTITNSNAGEMVKNVFLQAPVARMQAKRGLLGSNFTNELNPQIEIEKQLFNAAIKTGDYKGPESFMGHNEFKEKISN